MNANTRTAPQQPIKLHRMALSGHCHRVEMFLSLLGLPYELVEVDLRAGAHKRPEFIAKNPFGQVPVIEDGQVTLADSNAILVYLDAAARVIQLFKRPDDPSDAMARANSLFKVMEQELAARAFLAGDKPTLADVANYSYVARAPEGRVSLEPYPKLRAWLARVEALPGFVPIIESPVGLAA